MYLFQTMQESVNQKAVTTYLVQLRPESDFLTFYHVKRYYVVEKSSMNAACKICCSNKMELKANPQLCIGGQAAVTTLCLLISGM